MSIAWSDADTITYIASVGVWDMIGTIRRDGTDPKTIVPPGKLVASSLSLANNSKTLALLTESPTHPAEVALMSSGNELPRRMTDSNPWLAQMRFAPQEVVLFHARDGLNLEGLLIRPLGEEERENVSADRHRPRGSREPTSPTAG